MSESVRAFLIAVVIVACATASFAYVVKSQGKETRAARARAAAVQDSLRQARRHAADSVLTAVPKEELASLPDTTFRRLQKLVSEYSTDRSNAARAWKAELRRVEAIRRENIRQDVERQRLEQASRREEAEVERIANLASCDASPEKIRLLLPQKWGENITAMVACGEIAPGMTTAQVRAAWGRPTDINRTTYSFGIHEQWVYGRLDAKYAYFEDGILTAIQH